MPLLVTSVPNLVQGISQQPDNLRYPGQSDEQINAWSTVVEGLVKRPPTEYVKKTENRVDTDNDLFTHFVKRDESNKYVVAVSLNGANVSLGVLNTEDGVRIPVEATATAASYLSGITNPREDLKALTVADYTFLVNKKKPVRSDPTLYSDPLRKEALIAVKLGDYEKAYSIYINGALVPVDTALEDHHESTTTNHQLATYISGPSTGSHAGRHADTEFIAKDLETCLQSSYGTSGTTENIGVTEVSVDAVNSSAGYFNRLGANLYTSWAFEKQYPVKLKFTVDQTIASVTNSSAKGEAKVVDGSIVSLELTSVGTGYIESTDSTYVAPVLTFQEYFFTKAWWPYDGMHRLVSSVPTPTPPTTGEVTITIAPTPTFNIVREGSLIKILSQSVDFSIRSSDGLADQGLGVIYKEVKSITDLPAECFNRFRVKVIGDAELEQDDYYVQFKTKDGEEFGEGSWVETEGWYLDDSDTTPQRGSASKFELNTMPIVLVPQLTDGNVTSFVLESPEESLNVEVPLTKGWRGRNAGDGLTNPFPSFTSTDGAFVIYGDFVTSGGNNYRCIRDHEDATIDPTNTEYWKQIADVPAGTGAWVGGTAYRERGYRCTTSHADATILPTDTDYWIAVDIAPPNTETWVGGETYTGDVNRTINDIFFFKNRLGLLTDSNIIFSEADEYFNFFRTTSQQLLDSAPIDVGLSHTKVAQLQHALPFQEKLMLFSRQSQFVLRGADLLTPKTVSISPVTEYDISDNIDPVALGNYIYFPFKRDAFEGMYEYFVDNNTEVFEANEITAQVPKLIPSNITHLVGTASENMIVAKSSNDDYTLFVYKYYWQNKEKIQSAWMKFTYSRKIRGFDFIDSDLLLLTEDTEGLHLEKATMENGLVDDGLTYKLYLDSRIAGDAKDESDINILTVAYNSSDKTTTISGFPYDPVNVEVYTKGGTFKDFTRTTATAGTVSGALGSYVDNGGDFVNHNGVTYYCLQDNGGTGVTEPGVGEEWTQYWKVVDFDVSRPTWINSDAWENIVTNWESLTTSWDTGATYTGGVVYKCIKDHTSTAATEPGVGADWATYWVASADFTTYAFWLLGNDYHDDRYFFAGIPYNMLYRFSNQILKQPTERGGRSASDYTFQTIRNASIEYADTGHFTVEVTPRFRDTYKYPYNPALLASISTLNDFTPESGHFRFAVQAQPNEATIEIKSDSALPCKLLAAEFESMVIPRAKRYGS
jgi:hypothetical protein